MAMRGEDDDEDDDQRHDEVLADGERPRDVRNRIEHDVWQRRVFLPVFCERQDVMALLLMMFVCLLVACPR